MVSRQPSTASITATKVAAHASKHAAVSYQRAGEMITQLELEVAQLLAKAEGADATPLEEGLKIPEEIVRRQERKAALAKARAQIEARAQARYAQERAAHEEKLAQRAARQERGEKVGGNPPRRPARNLSPRTSTTSPTRRAGS